MEHTCTAKTLAKARRRLSILNRNIYIQHVFRSFFVSFFLSILFMSFVILLPYTYLLFFATFLHQKRHFWNSRVHGFRTLLHTDTHSFSKRRKSTLTHIFVLFRSMIVSVWSASFSINFQNNISSIGFVYMFVAFRFRYILCRYRHVHCTSWNQRSKVYLARNKMDLESFYDDILHIVIHIGV